MNFLAHAYLSFGDEEILVGNMISDFVKGKKKFEYPPGIQKGITLHRAIDTFTDNHEATKQAKQVLKPAVALYAGAFVDVAYDHFLATDNNEFTEESLKIFAATIYNTLYKFENILPLKFAAMLPFMQRQNWLYHYRTIEGAGKSFGGVVRRSAYLESSDRVFILFQNHYYFLKKCYESFFPDIKRYAFDKLKELQDDL